MSRNMANRKVSDIDILARAYLEEDGYPRHRAPAALRESVMEAWNPSAPMKSRPSLRA